MPSPFIYILIILLFQSFNVSAEQQTLNIISQNLNRFFDDKDDGNKAKTLSRSRYQKRQQQLVNKIANEYIFADVIALQEVENKSILLDVSKILKSNHDKDYAAILYEGNDISGIDVGFLVKKNIQIKSVKPLFSNKTYSHKGEKLFSRPPLVLEFCLTQCYTIVNLHLRSMRGLKSPKHQKRVILKRRLQAEILARWIDQFQHQHPQHKLIVLGDFNALTPSDSYVDSVGTIIGSPDQKRPMWKSPDLIKNDLVDVSLQVKRKYRYSYIYKKRKQLLDYLLVSENLKNKIKSLSFSRIDYRFSDHAALKAKIFDE